jgi:hypothetical protein
LAQKAYGKSMFLRIVYTIFLGLLLATFVGVGIAAFYKQPKYPEYPPRLQYAPTVPEKSGTTSAEYVKEQEAYTKKTEAFQKISEEYNKNVSIIALIAAIIFVVGSLTLVKHILAIADGVLLGGVVTLIYSIGRGFSANDDIFRFFVVSVGLFIALIVGYLKFVKPASKK